MGPLILLIGIAILEVQSDRSIYMGKRPSSTSLSFFFQSSNNPYSAVTTDDNTIDKECSIKKIYGRFLYD